MLAIMMFGLFLEGIVEVGAGLGSSFGPVMGSFFYKV